MGGSRRTEQDFLHYAAQIHTETEDTGAHRCIIKRPNRQTFAVDHNDSETKLYSYIRPLAYGIHYSLYIGPLCSS